MTLYITYDNSTLQDGLGAQALRIVGIYSISKSFGLKYIHSEILKTVEEFSHSQDSGPTELALQKFNAFFRFPESKLPNEFTMTINVRELSPKILVRYIRKYYFSHSIVLLRILLPFPVTDRLPAIYGKASKYIWKKRELNINLSRAKSIVAHVRFGYGWMYGEQSHLQKRKLLSPLYFSKVLESSFRFFSLPEKVDAVIHTDLSKVDRFWRPKQLETLEGYRAITGMRTTEEIFITGRDLALEIKVPRLPKLDIRYCDDTYTAFLEMCNADVLIMGTSTFSYLAGLINQNFVVWPSIHGHKKHPRWFSEKDLGIISLEGLFEKQVKN